MISQSIKKEGKKERNPNGPQTKGTIPLGF